MTSRELTSGFNFWSRGHLRMAVMHLFVKCGADIDIESGVIDIFPKLNMEAAAILYLLAEQWDHPWRLIRGAYCVLPVKISHDWSAKYKNLNFLSLRVESPIQAPKNSVFGSLPQKFRGTSFKPPKGTSLRGTAEGHVLGSYWSRSDEQCDLWPWQSKQNKKRKKEKDSGKLAIRPNHPWCHIEVKVCMLGGLQWVVLYIKFY